MTRAEILQSASVYTARLVLVNKGKISGEVRFKARYVIELYFDMLKEIFKHGVQTIQPTCVRELVALAAIFNL